MADYNRWIHFPTLTDYEIWCIAAAAKLGRDTYTPPVSPRLTPADGSYVAMIKTYRDVWDGPVLTASEIMALGYVPPPPPPPGE